MISHGDRPSGFARWLKWMGALLILVGAFGDFLTGFIAGYFFRVQPDEAWLEWLGLIVRALIIVLGAFLIYRGKQLTARAQAPGILEDERPPVVYLRPFAHDESMAGQVLTSFLTQRLYTGLFSTEEQLAEAVAPLGPLIAIGQPGEHLPKPGAVRAYASDAEWKDVVDRWLSKARLVIFRPGMSEGVWWEMERVFTTVQPERILVLLVRVKRADYESFAESVQARFGIVLPRFDAIRRHRHASGFLEFSGGWNARFLPLRAPVWRRSPYKIMRRLFHQALQPVFPRFGVDWRPLRISIATTLSLGFLGLFAATIVVALVSYGIGALTGRHHDEPPGSLGSGSRMEASLPQEPPSIPAPEWSSSSVAGLQISAPGTFERARGRDYQELLESQRKVLQTLEYYQLETETMSVQVIRSTFKPGVRFRVDATVQGSLNGLARLEGASDLRHSVQETRVSGHPALRASAWFTLNNQNMRFEILSFDVGPTLWLVVAGMPDAPDADETLGRILDSVRLAEARF